VPMQIDGYTVLISGILIRTLLAILFLAFWVKDRRAIWFGWWSAAFFLGDPAALAYLFGGFAVMFSPLGIMAAAVIAAIACFWQGARAFEGRAPLWLPVLGIPALWLLACLIPGFLDDLSYRVALSSLVLALISAVIAFEFWRGRREKLPSRWAIIALFLSLSAFFASRIALVGIAPYPFGALPMQTSWLAVFPRGSWTRKTVQAKKLDPSRLITHRFPLDRILDAYDTFGRAAETQALKVIIAA